MKRFLVFTLVCFLPSFVYGELIVSQSPVAGGGVLRWSQLWQDPSPAGNNLDGDSVCWEDFTLDKSRAINHIEWWGNGACELGFQIEVWSQDPGTVAYQPLAVWDYGYYGSGNPPVTPAARFRVLPTDIATSVGSGGLTHYSLDLASPIDLAANDSGNPRWFIGIIGLTAQAYYNWSWAQNAAGSSHTYQFIRGGSLAGGDRFVELPEGRSLVLADATVPEPSTLLMLGLVCLGLSVGLQRRI